MEASLIGQTILGYRVETKLGAGAFGTVYKVSKRNASGEYIRALKHITIPNQRQYNMILNSMGGDHAKADHYFEAVLQELIEEIKILNTLSEKGTKYIVRYYESDILQTESPRRYDIYILMEHLIPFVDYIETHDLTVAHVIDLGINILEGLKVCHENGIIHRDVKDDNLFVTKEGIFKLGDFGVSKVLNNQSRASSMKGTPCFIAPEVYLGKESYTASVDLYSLGIVLYRLLNYMRQPFLPQYPAVYHLDDEENAFAERMKGIVPPLPQNGGEQLGGIIIKAISGKEVRYKEADEFIKALVKVKGEMSQEELQLKINMPKALNMQDTLNNQKPQAEQRQTIGNLLYSAEHMEAEEEDARAYGNLFDTLGSSCETSNQQEQAEKQQERPEARCQQTSHKTNNQETRQGEPLNSAINNLTNPVYEQEVTPIDKKILAKFVYIFPFIVLVIGIVVFYGVLPKTYGRTVSMINWLSGDVDEIIEVISRADKVLPKAYSVIGFKVASYIWLSTFIASLFMVGKQLQKKQEVYIPGTSLRGKEVYYLVVKISGELKVKAYQDKELNSLVHRMKHLEGRFKFESDFGCSNQAVTDIENEIIGQVYLIQNTIADLKGNTEKVKQVEGAIVQIENYLVQRKELKRR